jgi:hypothetical protein
MSNPSPEDLRLDYQQTCEQFKLLADIRFKLIAFVPTLTGAAISLLSSDKVSKESAFVVGILGLFVTVGIIIYDLRNSQFYGNVIARAKFLEAKLYLPNHHNNNREYGGIFLESPSPDTIKLFPKITIIDEEKNKNGAVIKIKLLHDRGLALVYSASFGGWFFIIINSALLFLGLDKLTIFGIESLNVFIISVPIAIFISSRIYGAYIKIGELLRL